MFCLRLYRDTLFIKLLNLCRLDRQTIKLIRYRFSSLLITKLKVYNLNDCNRQN